MLSIFSHRRNARLARFVPGPALTEAAVPAQKRRSTRLAAFGSALVLASSLALGALMPGQAAAEARDTPVGFGSNAAATFAPVGRQLTPMGYSSRGNAAITQNQARQGDTLVTLEALGTVRASTQTLPLAMPVQSAFRFTSGFGRRWNRAHQGIDLAGPVGTPIYSTGDGIVIFAGRQSGYGNVIKIQHAMGTETRYGHLSRIHVQAGQKVSRGSRIGDMGNTGRSTGPHLHYEVRVNGRAVNPLSFIKAAQNVF